jgi:L-aspartate oxidase
MSLSSNPKVDFVVVGSGVSGLRAAIDLAAAGTVLLLTKGHASESITHQARGGIAVAPDDEEGVSVHLQETLRSGDNLCREEAVRVLVQEGPAAIKELSDWGARFDWKSAATPVSGHEGRKRARVLRSPGNTTGAEILRVLVQKTDAASGLRKNHRALLIDLLLNGSEVAGVTYLDEQSGAIRDVRASAVLLATGGLGEVYSETTNPSGACGGGLTVGFRAGALLSDMEFVQFHPTALCVQNAPRIGLPETLRHKGARLRNIELQRFMYRYSEAGELAPWDIVARAISIEMKRLRSDFVYLDLTGLDPGEVKSQFLHVYNACLESNIDITSDLVPVRPAAHFAIGGLATGLNGVTTLKRLYAAGESAATGLNGANRLANNSLLEGLVFGKRAAAGMIAGNGPVLQLPNPENSTPPPWLNTHRDEELVPSAGKINLEDLIRNVRSLMWSHVGVIRDGKKLAEAGRQLNEMSIPICAETDRRYYETRSILEVARLITTCAAARKESRGVHYRADFPLRNDTEPAKHSFISKHTSVFFRN